ncbi:SMI1/KNR4 family protein [Deinococcus aestuarii]|uniref:SMI1/KNR4 family protein n=1 Tax=Deinococcus aestuarii TaxID=2774531 RepID=UPI001C0BF63E|nr:SMI1/KNR4 family protein [Deinococcus aestuarii]
MTSDLPAVLARLDAWLAAHVPAIHATLRPGASDTELDALEPLVGQKLPESFRTLYRWHDGEQLVVRGVFSLAFLPLAQIQFDWETWQDIGKNFPEMNQEINSASHPTGSIREAYTTPGWLGFLSDLSGNSVGLDFNPGPAGKLGQVITFGRDQEYKYVLAESLEAFLREYLTRLEAGQVQIVNREAESFLYLLDADGRSSESHRQLTDLYPGFGAAPARRSR